MHTHTWSRAAPVKGSSEKSRRMGTSLRIITARFTSNGRNITIIHCYAQTNSAEFEEKDTFYQHLQTVIQKLPKRDIQVVTGDMNAKIGKDNDN